MYTIVTTHPDHTRGLCGKPDMSKYGKAKDDFTIAREVVEADPPLCRCCGHTMRVVEMSASLDQLRPSKNSLVTS